MYHQKRKQFSLTCSAWLLHQIQKRIYFFAWLLHQIQKSIYYFVWLFYQIQKSIYFFAWFSNFCHTCRPCLWRRWYTAVHTETAHTVVVWQQPTSMADKEEETWSEHVLQVFVALVNPATPPSLQHPLHSRAPLSVGLIIHSNTYFTPPSVRLLICLSACLPVCECACMRMCVSACVRACVCSSERASVRACSRQWKKARCLLVAAQAVLYPTGCRDGPFSVNHFRCLITLF